MAAKRRGKASVERLLRDVEMVLKIHSSLEAENIRGIVIFLDKGKDLSDAAMIAHAKGKQVLKTKAHVRVLPYCVPIGPLVSDGYLVIVAGRGVSYNQPLVGKGRGEHNEKGTSSIQRVSRGIDNGLDPSYSGHFQPLIPAV